MATHAPLSAEFGAAQAAINLSEALQEQGYDVTLWSPHPLPSFPRWWQRFKNIQLIRSKLDAFLDTQEPFDVIDCTGALITKKVSRSINLIVARSVQPEILYILSGLLNPQKKILKQIALLPFNCFFGFAHLCLLVQGWTRASYILCLGSLELEWMKKWFPWWEYKSLFYINALSNKDQIELAKVRLNRIQKEKVGVNFLWIGRWVAHKGIDRLVDFILQRIASNPQDTFTIAGCGLDAEKNFPPELIKLGVVKFIPSFVRSELYPLLANHDAGLFTSKIEGWGLTLNEMLESGMPVFATRAGGVPDLQPYFETLMSFPPPEKLTSHLSNSCQIIDNYHVSCSWHKVAEIYITKILTI